MKIKQEIKIEKELVERIKKLGYDPKEFIEKYFENITAEQFEKLIKDIKEGK
ncbi:hypothetical protein [Fusobacterium varium]|uniref:hypothetical protein n=1 Tax=Fusobacterium varium TaxID=856 RepID=UPI0029255BD0|nr:hypothetical protein AUSP0054_00062 [uncultured phage]